MSEIIDSIDLGEVSGFKIKLNALAEHIPLRDTLDESILKETIDQVNNYDLMYFCAQVTASKNGIELSSDYLGACLYKSLEEFSKDNCCKDMIKTVISEAKQAIQELLKD